MHQLLIIDDEPAICASLTFALEDSFQVSEAHSAEEGLQAIRNREFDIVLLDLKLGLDDGIETLKQIKAEKPRMVVIIMTAFGSIQSSVAAMRAGAFYYLTKPINMDELQMLLGKAADYLNLESKVQYLNNKLTEIYEVGGIIGQSAAMQRVVAQIEKLCNVGANVLITGESGTGKELVAKALHFGGTRKNEAFEAINCAAIPLELLESELFGHEKGAFSGAIQRRKGLFELANGGTIFLDEIGEMDLKLQAKLLRVVQDKEILPVGSEQRKKVDVRILAATNRDPQQLLREGKFREDLFFRLNVVNIHLPALRERPEDIPPLVRFFFEKYSRKMGRSIPRIDEAALAALKQHPYQGNVRELENIIEKTMVFLSGEEVRLDDLPMEVRPGPLSNRATQAGELIQVRIGQDLDTIQKNVILATLNHFQGNKLKTAEVLKISERKLWYKLKEYE
ncbi:MAG: sigma-54-dependent Fis family transcriptional regulator [Veillonellaceae bacterium]|nr:sigma-54-dependent Fis family transcriptional regulator [Veillonellaceae bacterium]